MKIWKTLVGEIKKKVSESYVIELGKNCTKFYKVNDKKKESILVNGKKCKIIVKNTGFDYYELNYIIKEVFYKLERGCLVKEFPQRTEYFWKED